MYIENMVAQSLAMKLSFGLYLTIGRTGVEEDIQ